MPRQWIALLHHSPGLAAPGILVIKLELIVDGVIHLYRLDSTLYSHACVHRSAHWGVEKWDGLSFAAWVFRIGSNCTPLLLKLPLPFILPSSEGFTSDGGAGTLGSASFTAGARLYWQDGELGLFLCTSSWAGFGPGGNFSALAF